jgi:predicted lipid carrier protein YhbT
LPLTLWESLINLVEIHIIEGDSETALQLFERSYQVMDNIYQELPQKVGRWQAELGVFIAQEHQAKGRLE